LDACEALLRFGGLGHTCVIYSKDDARIREFAVRMPAFRVLVNTSAPAGSTGMTTNLMPSMTLGCGAMAGNITGDNVGPQHLINIKRLAYGVRTPEEALTIPAEFKTEAAPAPAAALSARTSRIDRQAVQAAVERYLTERGISIESSAGTPRPVTSGTIGNVAAEVVDRFLSARLPGTPAAPAKNPGTLRAGYAGCSAPGRAQACPQGSFSAPQPPAPEVVIADFVCESDVKTAIQQGRKIYIGPKTIVTPAARDLGTERDVLVTAQRE
jgi:hypothetical protein